MVVDRVASLKRECLDFFICISRSQLDHICRTWVAHYNTDRPHQGHGIDNNVLDVDFKTKQSGPIESKEALGGIIRSYYRKAA